MVKTGKYSIFHNFLISKLSGKTPHNCLGYNQVTLTVDGKYTERWRTVGKQSHLASSLIIMGGSEGRGGESQLLQATNNLVGCLKKVSQLRPWKGIYCQEVHTFLLSSYLDPTTPYPFSLHRQALPDREKKDIEKEGQEIDLMTEGGRVNSNKTSANITGFFFIAAFWSLNKVNMEVVHVHGLMRQCL